MNSEKIILKHIDSKISSGNLKDCYVTPFPKVFRYSDSHSIRKDSIVDLKLSWASNYIARNSARANVGDGVLVVARSSLVNKVNLFAGVVVSEAGETDLWKNYGGHKWKFSYEIEKLSAIASIHEAIVESIINLDFSWKYFTGLNFDKWGTTTRNGIAMKKLFDYCVDNYPIKNRDALVIKNINDLNNKVSISK